MDASSVPYEVLKVVMAGEGSVRQRIGSPGRCRFCREPACTFRKVAHTIPEALGNKWIESLDECDVCNSLFSEYESDLAESVGPLLTLAGVPGKRNRTRQTGRSGGASVLRHFRDGKEPRRISVQIDTGRIGAPVAFTWSQGQWRGEIPIPNTRFRPRYAYKALTEIAYALLPDAELIHFEQLREWLLDIDDVVDFPDLEVTLSTYMGPPAPVVTAILFRRKDDAWPVPYMQLLLQTGPVCFQIDLRSDHMDDNVPPLELGSVALKATTEFSTLSPKLKTVIDYSNRSVFNWSSRVLRPQPITTVLVGVELESRELCLEPVFRDPGEYLDADPAP